MNRTSAVLIAGVLSLVLAFGAVAAPTSAPGVSKPDEMVTIDLAGVTLHAVVQYISEFSGKPVLLPDRFPGDRKVDIVSSGQAAVPAKKAMEILSTALLSAGYLMIETPYQIQVVPETSTEGAPLVRDQTEGAMSGQTLVTITKVVLKADASKLQAILQTLKSKAGSVQIYPDSNTLVITEYGPQLKTMLALVDMLDTHWEANRPDIVKLEKASVDSLRSVVEAFVKNMALNAEPAVRQRLASFSIIVQPPINSFVLFGYPDDVVRVTEFIRMIDVLPGDASRAFHTYRVLNRDVTDMVTVLNSVFNAVKARNAGAAEQCPTVIADQVNSALIVIASPDRYAEYLPLFQQIDMPRDQVQIESAIVELSTDRLAELGVELATADIPTSTSGIIGAAATSFGLKTLNATGTGSTPVPPPNGGLTAAIFKNLNIPAIARLSLQDQNVAFIAGPLVTTNDNCKATVDISEERQTQQSIISPEGTTSGVTSGPPVTASVSLEITPHINEEGTVRMEIASLTEEFEPTTITTAGVPLYNKNTRKATTQVTVPTGSTIVIGGLTRTEATKTISKVPFLGDIPLLGFFFRDTQSELTRLNLCIFITPHVLRNKLNLAEEVQRKKAELKAMNESVPDLQNGGVNQYVAPEPVTQPAPDAPPETLKAMSVSDNRKTLDALQKAGLISEAQAAALAAACETDWRPPAEIIRLQPGMDEDRLSAWAAEYLGVPYVASLSGLVAPEEFFQKVPPEYARQVGAVARRIAENEIEAAVALGPDMHSVIAELSILFERPVVFVLAPRREIEAAVDRSVRQRPEYLEYAAGELPEDEFAESAARIERVTDFAELMRKTPVVKLVSLLVAQAVRNGSSDIHFQPTGDRLRVRFRTDGILHDVLDLPRSSQDAILSRVKVLGKMDIAERRSPQDGRASFRYADREIDVRMSVIPTDEGERAVLRLLDKEQKLLKLEEVGLAGRELREFDRLINMSHGMLLVTGPTGSGKTTTLYAALMKINSPEQNIITIEDPVEYKIPGISQIQVLARKNVTFGSMLRSVVRQDPDIIMIGEIRDEETASIAVQSSLTGHLVFSTLHTNDSAGAIARLLDLAVEPFLLSSALLAVLAQRLVRQVCPACGRQDATVSDADLALLGLGHEQGRQANLRRGAGCDQCMGTGYRGRLGIFELLLVDEAIRPLINRRASASEIREAGTRNGLTLLRADGAGKALAGLTTVEEILRVTQRDDNVQAPQLSQPPSAAAQR